MASSKTFIEIEIEQAEKFSSLLDKVNAKLEKLDTGLTRVQQTTKGMTFKIQGIKDLERLAALSNTFNTQANLKPFQNLQKIAGYIAETSNILRGVGSEKFRTLVSIMDSLVTVDNRISLLGNLTGFKASSLRNFSSMLTTLLSLATRAEKLNTTGLDRLPAVINVFGDVLAKVKNFASFATVVKGVLQASVVNALLSTIDGILKIAKKSGQVAPGDILKVSMIFTTFQSVTRSLNGMGAGVMSAATTRIALLTINGLVSIMGGLTTLIKAASKIDSAGIYHVMPIIASFRMLVQGISGIGSIGDLGKGLVRGAVIKSIESFFVTLTVLANMGTKVNAASFDSLAAATEDLLKLLGRIQGLGTFGNFLKGFKANLVTSAISGIVRMLSDMAKLGGSSARTLSSGLHDFMEVVLALSEAANSEMFSVRNMVRITAFFLAFSLLAQIPTRMAISEGVINEFIAVGLAMQRIGLALEKVLFVVQNIKISPLRPGLLNDLNRFSTTMKVFGKELRNVVDAVFATEKTVLIFKVKRDPVSPEQITSLAKLIGSMGRALELITSAAKRVGVLGTADLPFSNINRIADLFLALRRGVQQILTVLTDTRPLFKKILGMGSGAPDAKNMEALAKLLTSLSSIIRRVFASMNSFTGGHFDVRADSQRNVDARIKFLKDLVNSFRGFTGKTLPPNLSPVLAKVPEILKALADINNIQGGKGNANMKASVDGLKEFFNTLSKLNVKKTQALGDLGAALKLFGSIKALGSLEGLIKAVNQIVVVVNTSKIDRGSFKGLKGATDELAKALKILEKVNVTTTQVEAVKAMAAALGSLTKTKIQPIDANLVDVNRVRQTGFNTGREMADAVEEGVITANLKLFLIKLYTQVGVGILRALNPVAIAGKLVEGAQALWGFAQRIVNVFDNVEAKIKNIGSSIDQLGDRLRNLGNTLNTNFGLNTLTNTAAFTNAADFDQLLTQVQVFGNLTESELEQVRKAAVQVGIDFPQSAAQGLQAGLNLIKAGLGPAAVEATLPVAAALASLSDSGDLDRISNGVIQVVNSFKQLNPTTVSGFENASVVADILSSAADNSTASIESLFDGLQNVGPAASAFGLDLQQTTAILSIFSQNGIQGAEAGTQLRTVLRTLQGGPAQAELRRLGVSLTDTEGNFRSMIDIVGDLNRAMNTPRTVRTIPGLGAEDQALLQEAQRAYAAASRNIRVYQNDLQSTGVSEEQRAERLANYTRQQQAAAATISRLSGNVNTANAILTEIDRTQAQNAQTILQLGGAYGQLGLATLLSGDENAIAAFIERMNAMPPAVDRARQMLDNFKGDVQQLQGSLETAGIVALQPLLDVYFRPMVQILRSVVDGFLALPQPLQEAVGWFVALGSTLATVTGSALIIVGALTSLGGNVLTLVSGLFSLRSMALNVLGVFTGMVTGIATVTLVILPLVAAFGAVALGIVTFRKVISENIGNAGQVFARFKASLGSVLRVLGDGVSAFVEFFSVLFTGGQDSSVSALQRFGEVMAFVFGRLDTTMREFGVQANAFITGFRRFTEAIQSGFSVTDRFVRGQLSNPFLAWLFGATGRPPLSVQSVTSFLTVLSYAAGQIRFALAGISAALTTFVSSLSSGVSISEALSNLQVQLQFGVASLGSGMLKLVGELFNIDFSAATTQLDRGNLEAGAYAFLDTIVGSIRNVLLGNRDAITDVLVTVFDTLFVPGKMFERVAGWLGLENVENVIKAIRDTISNGFRGIVETFFNLLEGDDLSTALSKAFGPGIEPLFKFIDELRKGVENIIGIVGGLLNAIFSPEVTGEAGSDIGSLVSGALEGAAGILKTLNDVVLGPLSAAIAAIDLDALSAFFNNLFDGVSTFFADIGSGDWQGAALALGGAVGGIVKTIRDLVTGLFSSVDAENSGSFVSSVGGAIANALQGAITFALGSIGAALGVDPTQFFEDMRAAFEPLVSAIQTGDPFTIVGNLGGAVVKTIGAALNLALSGIGQLLGIDTSVVQKFISDTLGGVVNSIVALFNGEKGSLSSTIVPLIESFVTVIQNLFTAVQSAGSSADAQSLLTSLGDFFTKASGVAVAVLSVPINALRSLLERLGEMDAVSTTAIMAAIGGLVVIMGARSLVSNLSSLTTFMRQAGSPIATGAAIFVLVDFLVNLINNLRELGDLSQTTLPEVVNALVNTFVDLGADIASVLGFEDVATKIRGLEDRFLELAQQFPIVAARLGAVVQFEISKFTNSIIAGIQLAFAQARVEVEAGANTLAGRGEQFEAFRFAFNDQLQQAINSGGATVDLGAFFANVVSASNVNGFDIPESLRQEFIGKARQSLDVLMLAFQTDLQESAATEDQGAMRQTISDWFLLITGIGDPQFAFDTILQQGDMSFVQTMLDTLGTMTAEELAAANVDSNVVGQMAQSILDAFNRGLLTQDQAFSLLGNQIFTELSPDDAQRVREQIQAFIAQVQAIVDEVSATDVLSFKGTVRPEAGKRAGGKGEGEQDTAGGGDLASMLGASADAFIRLRDEATMTSTTLMVQLGMMSVVTTPLIGLMNLGLTSVRDRFSEILYRVGLLATTMTVTTPIVMAQSALLQFSLSTMATNAVSDLDRLVLKLNDIKRALDEVMGTLGVINTTQVTNPTQSTGRTGGSSGGSTGRAPQRASGGSTNAGQQYQVLERGEPELFKDGDKYYMLSPTNGRVLPLTRNIPRPAAGNNYGGSTSVNYNPTINIDINGSNLDPNQLSQIVYEQLQQSNAAQREDIARMLRLRGRSGT